MNYKIGPELKLKEVVRNLALKAETGLLRVLPPEGKSGEIYLKEGRPVHAAFGLLEGLDALYGLAFLEIADASFEPDKEPAKGTLPEGLSIDELFERRRIQIREIKRRLPLPDAVLVKSQELPRTDSLALRKTDWQVLMLFDGRRDLKTAVDNSPLPEETTLQSIDWLLETGLLIDPQAEWNLLKKRIAYLNQFLEEFGNHGIGRQFWLESIKELLAKHDRWGTITRFIKLSDRAITFEASETNLDRNAIDAVFAPLVEGLIQKAELTHGPALTRWKIRRIGD